MLFKDLKGLDGVDKLSECVQYVDSIFSDTELVKSIKESTWVVAATQVYKTHTDDVNKLLEILEEKPETSAEIITTTAKMLVEMFKDKDICAFFMLSCESMNSAISAMESTKGEQSADLSDT